MRLGLPEQGAALVVCMIYDVPKNIVNAPISNAKPQYKRANTALQELGPWPWSGSYAL
jgi:hypothetical protein